jgi:spore maturation protein CgeB
MINAAFFFQHFLVQTEVVEALKRITGIRTIVINIADRPEASQAEAACKAIADNNCAILFTINDWGLDAGGITADFLEKKSIAHVNWCVDDPFFTEIYHNRSYKPKKNRVDFVSNRAYVTLMNKRGYDAHFLPLAADPTLFTPPSGHVEYEHEICFVGNSYKQQIDEFCTGHEDFLDTLVPFMGDLVLRYQSDITTDIDNIISSHITSMKLPDNLPMRKAVFIIKHFISYLYRKRLICGLAADYPEFTVYGDAAWLGDIPEKQFRPSVSYYFRLGEIYRKSKINIDINRVVITEGLTQRIFDCLAGNSFILTSKKAIVSELFNIDSKLQEVVLFDNEQHCRDLINYYLKHDSERMVIAERGRNRVLSEHTYDHRIREMLKIVSARLGASRS